MGERTTSRDEADHLKREITGLVDRLERAGYARDQVGSAMGGIGLALVQVHCSPRSALAMVETLRDILLSDQAVKQ